MYSYVHYCARHVADSAHKAIWSRILLGQSQLCAGHMTCSNTASRSGILTHCVI